MASLESMLAAELIYFIRRYIDYRTISGRAGHRTDCSRFSPRQIRAPDVSFIRWERFPGGQLPEAAIFSVAPDLAVEILSEGNTAEEMNRKLREYFQAGVRLVWYIEPKTRTARAYTADSEWTEIGSNDSLFGGEVLPGFELPLAQLFLSSKAGRNVSVTYECFVEDYASVKKRVTKNSQRQATRRLGP